ncbi:MAG: universal stress protein [Acidimicrobiales bacterium]
MRGFDSLVVGLDGSPAATTALDWAIDHLEPDGELHAVHGLSPLLGLGRAALQTDVGGARAEVRRMLDVKWTDPARAAGRDVVTHLVDDDPGDAALAVAERVGADAIVVGPHGVTMNLQVLGGVTRRILHQSSIPTIVARASADGDGPIVSFVGYGQATEGAARWAALRADAEGTGLVLLHAVGYRPLYPLDSPADTVASYLGSEVADDWARADLERLRSELEPEVPGVAIETRVERGSVVAAIEAISPRSRLIVVGKRHTNRLARRVVSHRLQQAIVRSSATVAVVPSHPPAAA